MGCYNRTIRLDSTRTCLEVSNCIYLFSHTLFVITEAPLPYDCLFLARPSLVILLPAAAFQQISQQESYIHNSWFIVYEPINAIFQNKLFCVFSPLCL